MLEIGQLVDGKYKILNKIGQGGMSVVYLAMNEKANKQWAIKEVRKDGKQDFDVVKQGLVAEIDMLKKLNHPNLPSIIDVIDGDGTFLIVMDYIQGNPLDKRLAETGAQPQEDVIEWSKQLCDVLGYLHSRKPPIIYRDMKPANVMLKPEGTVTLIDFGTAREFKYANVEDTTCLGTRGYAAPEQFGGQGQTDARTDIYCLGATMYHLITGHNPSMPPYEMYPIRYWNPLLSSGLEEIIIKCTQKNPAERYQSCAELMYALEHYQELDIENRKVQNFKWKLFLTTVITSVVMGVSAITCHGLEVNKRAKTYDSNVQSAKDETLISKQLEIYKDAISLAPGREEAYLGLLESVESDGRLDRTEDEALSNLLAQGASNGNDDDKDINVFRSNNPEEYGRFCYRIGLDYYFSFYREEDGELIEAPEDGIKKSAKWFEYAVESDEFMNSGKYDSEARIASIMSRLSANFGKWGENRNNLGQVVDGYDWIDYWQLIVDMCDPQETNIAKNISATMAINVYRNFAIVIKNNADKFCNIESVGKAGVLAQLNVMRDYLEPTNLQNVSKNSYNPDDLNDVNNLEITRKAIDEATSVVSTVVEGESSPAPAETNTEVEQ